MLTSCAVLATMAENVMTHYENVKEKEDRKRVLNMNMCLAAFVDPENQVKKHRRRRPTSQPGGGSKKPSSSVARDTGVGAEGLRRKSPQQSHASSHNGDSDSHSAATASSFGNRVEEDDTMETFKRAADLLHASLSLAGGGGIVFMDTATSYRSVRTLHSGPSVFQERSVIYNRYLLMVTLLAVLASFDKC